MRVMPLSPLNEHGDLPISVHVASWSEVVARFGVQTEQRSRVSARLARIRELARATGALDRVIVFGSYVTAKPEPNDVDVILVMRDDFHLAACPPPALPLFDHRRAEAELGASVFWIRPGLLFGETVEQFITGWQVRREGGRRGIIEVCDDPE